MRVRTAATVVVMGLVAGVVACSPDRLPPRRNLVLITLDTTRADRLGCYGSATVQTPNLDRIAAGGTVFEHAFATAPITAPSHASILSGTFPPFHQVRDNDVFVVPKDLPWLPAILSQRGYRTTAVVAAFPLRSAAGFARGFDYYGDQLEAPQGSLVVTNLQSVGVPSRQGERISEEFGLWLEAGRDSRPFFAWLHYYDPHWPWTPGAGYAELYPDHLYDGEVAYMDDCIGSVLRALSKHGLAESTGLVVVADHGEGLDEHEEQTHALLLYNGTLRVPLVVRLPWLKAQRQRVDSYVSGADVMPTVLDSLGIDPGELGQPLQGRSLLSLLNPSQTGADVDSIPDRPLYFETFYPFYHHRWSPLSGFVFGGLKFIHGPVDEVYDLNTDLDEMHDLAGNEDLAALELRLEALKAELRRGRPATGRHGQSREELAKLRALGYVGSVSTTDAEAVEDLTALPHPRTSMGLFSQYNQIRGLAQDDRIAEALEMARSVVAIDPTQKDARMMVASFNVRLGRSVAADKAYADLVADFADKDVVFQAGSYFLTRRDLPRARQCFEQLVADSPEDLEAMTRLAQTVATEGDSGAARRIFEQVLGIDPAYREALLGLAVLLDRGGLPEGETYFEEAAAKYPFDPQVNFDFGVYLLRHGRDREAVERLQRAALLSSGPLFDSAQLALASYHQRRGELDQARACLRKVVLETSNPNALRQAEASLVALGGG